MRKAEHRLRPWRLPAMWIPFLALATLMLSPLGLHASWRDVFSPFEVITLHLEVATNDWDRVRFDQPSQSESWVAFARVPVRMHADMVGMVSGNQWPSVFPSVRPQIGPRSNLWYWINGLSPPARRLLWLGVA